jgi:Spy/CpxP family protein refolding chaperone
VRKVLLAVAVAVLGMTGTAAAQMPEAPPGKWWKRPRIAELLKLAPEQQDRLEAIFLKSRRNFVDLKADVERRQIDVEELLTRKDSDAKKTSQAIDALEQARLRLRKAATMMFLEQKDVLTTAQWQTIVDRREEWRRERQDERRMQRQGPGVGPPAGPGRRSPGGVDPAPPPRDEKPE